MQVLLDEAQYARLEREAARRGGSVASVVRDAVDRMLPEDAVMTRAQAADVLLDAAPVAVGDWVDVKEELLRPVTVDQQSSGS